MIVITIRAAKVIIVDILNDGIIRFMNHTIIGKNVKPTKTDRIIDSSVLSLKNLKIKNMGNMQTIVKPSVVFSPTKPNNKAGNRIISDNKNIIM